MVLAGRAHGVGMSDRFLGDNYDFITLHDMVPGGFGIGTITANGFGIILHRERFFRHTSKVRIYVATAAGNIDIAVGTLSGTTFNRIVSLGTTALSTTGVVEFNLSVDWQAGVDYYAGATLTDATAQISRSTGDGRVGQLGNRYLSKSGVGAPIPASVAGMSGSGGFVPDLIFL